MSLLRKWALTLLALLPVSAPELDILWKTSGCDSDADDEAASNRSWRDFLDSVALLPPCL